MTERGSGIVGLQYQLDLLLNYLLRTDTCTYVLVLGVSGSFAAILPVMGSSNYGIIPRSP